MPVTLYVEGKGRQVTGGPRRRRIARPRRRASKVARREPGAPPLDSRLQRTLPLRRASPRYEGRDLAQQVAPRLSWCARCASRTSRHRTRVAGLRVPSWLDQAGLLPLAQGSRPDPQLLGELPMKMLHPATDSRAQTTPVRSAASTVARASGHEGAARGSRRVRRGRRRRRRRSPRA